MYKPNTMITMVSAILAGSLLFGSSAFTASSFAAETSAKAASQTTAVAAAASTKVRTGFPDVPRTHWGIKHISKLAIYGVVEGYDNGTFKPEEKVSQQDVLIMAVRMMGLEEEAGKQNASAVLPFAVSDYAKKYVLLADAKGLIDRGEEAKNTGGPSWGAKEASREWVAKIVIRAINKQAEAQKLSSSPTIFTDNKDISAGAVGFINEAAALNIVQGFEKGDFQPKGTVTRAQMAAFLNRAEPYMEIKMNRSAKGYIVGLSDKKLVLQDLEGRLTEYAIGSDTSFFSSKSEKAIAPSSLKQTYEVSLVSAGGTAYYVEVTDDTQKLEVYEGDLFDLNVGKLIALLNVNGDYVPYELSPNVSVVDSEGKGLTLGTLIKGSQVQFTKNKLIKDPKITGIIVKKAPVTKTSEGTVKMLSRTDLAVQETSSGNTESFPLSSKLVIVNKDNANVDFTQLRTGDTVGYEIVNNEVTKIVQKKQASVVKTVQGSLSSVDPKQRTITVSMDGKLGAYYLTDAAEVRISGLATAGLYDLEPDDAVKLDIVDDKVTGVSVTNRAVLSCQFSTILNYDAKTKALTVQDDSGKLGAYFVTDRTDIYYGDAKVNLDTFGTLFRNGSKIDFQASKDRMINLKLASSVSGSITQLNLATKEITIRTASSQNLTFKLDSTVPVEIPNKDTASQSDLKIGDNVKLMLNYDQSLLAQIKAVKTGSYKVMYKNSANKQITVQDFSGASFVYTIADSVNVLNQNQTKGTFDSIPVEGFVSIAQSGQTIDSVSVLSSVRGKVSGVDAAGGVVTVSTGSVSENIAAGAAAAVKVNGSASSLSAVKVNDRIEAIRNPDGSWTLNVSSGLKKTVSAYDSVLNQLNVLPNGSDKTVYNFAKTVSIHKGAQNLTAGDLAVNDEVMIYLIDNLIVEIEKL